MRRSSAGCGGSIPARRRGPGIRGRGQAIAELALLLALMILLALGYLSFLTAHRVTAAARAAAYACASYLSQSADPARAAWMGREAARRTLEGSWSGMLDASFRVSVFPGPPGGLARCRVDYTLPAPFGAAVLGIGPREDFIEAYTRVEQWKGRWP